MGHDGSGCVCKLRPWRLTASAVPRVPTSCPTYCCVTARMLLSVITPCPAAFSLKGTWVARWCPPNAPVVLPLSGVRSYWGGVLFPGVSTLYGGETKSAASGPGARLDTCLQQPAHRTQAPGRKERALRRKSPEKALKQHGCRLLSWDKAMCLVLATSCSGCAMLLQNKPVAEFHKSHPQGGRCPGRACPRGPHRLESLSPPASRAGRMIGHCVSLGCVTIPMPPRFLSILPHS